MKQVSQTFAVIIFVTLIATTQILHAQSAIVSIANADDLPLRNLQIEVRQTRGSSASRQSPAGVTLSQDASPGNATFSSQQSAQDSQRSHTRDILQSVLVLNGRPVAINVGVNRPLRLVQTFIQDGVVRTVGGIVLIDANSGFSARPVWRGGGSVELELAAMQTLQSASNPRYPAGSASMSSTLTLALDQWVTVAQSDEAVMDINSRGGQSGGGEALVVEVRLSIR